MTEPTARRIALFIDFENLVTNTGITPSSFDLQPSLDRLLEKGKVIFRRAYCDWSRFKDAKTHLHEFGVELVEVPPSTRAGKNSADMRLVIDARVGKVAQPQQALRAVDEAVRFLEGVATVRPTLFSCRARYYHTFG